MSALPSVAEIIGPPRLDPAVVEALTEASHAQRFAEDYGYQLRFNHRRNMWLIYKPPIWRPDLNGQVYRLALEFVRSRQQSALEIPDKKLKEQVLKFCLHAESKAALDKLIGLAKNLEPVADTGEWWDVDPWLVGAPNGVLDLRSGRVRLGDPSDRITMTVGVPFDSDAEAPRWWQFLAEVFDADEDVIAFVQRFVGYCLTGLTTEQALGLFHGRGANGKGTLINTLAHVLGDYYGNMPFSTIELKQRASIPNDLAMLDGRRLVTASETNDGTRLNEARIKALTGCDPVTARFMHGEFFSFRPVAKFILAVNHRPTVQDDSYGFWRRIRLVPFKHTFQGTERDDAIEEKLKAEGPGILRWAVDGCLAWQRQGLGEPTSVRDATDEYRTESDVLGDFLGECCESEVTAVTKAGALFEAYTKWADRQRLSKADRLNGKDFGRRMAERFTRKHTNSGKAYEGIRLATNKLW